MLSFKKWCVLLVIYVIYMLAGAFIFVALEINNEKNERHDLYLLKQHVIDVVNGLDNSSQYEVEEVITEMGEECGHDFLSIEQDVPLTWSLWNSFFFSFTVITTIGFGHMYPKTPYGRVVCILYATLGVPLNGILISALADIFSAKLIIWDVKKWAERYRNSIQVAVDAALYVLPGLLLFLILPSFVIMMVEEGWSYLDCFYYAFITLTTIGFGDHVAGRQEKDQLWLWMYKIVSVLWIIFGLGYIIMVITFIQKALKNRHIRNVERKMTKILKKHVGKFSQNIRGDLRKVRKVVKGSSPTTTTTTTTSKQQQQPQQQQQQLPPLPLLPPSVLLKDYRTPYRRHRSVSESETVEMEKELYSGWSLDEVLELVERLLCEEELRTTHNLQTHIIQQLHRGFMYKTEEEEEEEDLEGDLEAGEGEKEEEEEDLKRDLEAGEGEKAEEEEDLKRDLEVGEGEKEEEEDLTSRYLQTNKTSGPFSRLMERLGHSKVLEINQRQHPTRGKIMFNHQDGQTNGKDREGKVMAIGYLNHCYQDDNGDPSQGYHPSHANHASPNHSHPSPNHSQPSHNPSHANHASPNHSQASHTSPNHSPDHSHASHPSPNHSQPSHPSPNHSQASHTSPNHSPDHSHASHPSPNPSHASHPSPNHSHHSNPSPKDYLNNENNPSNKQNNENNPFHIQNPNDNPSPNENPNPEQNNSSDNHNKNINEPISQHQDNTSHHQNTTTSHEFTKF